MTTRQRMSAVANLLAAAAVASVVVAGALAASRPMGFGAAIITAALTARRHGWESGLVASIVGAFWWLALTEHGAVRRVVDDPGTVRLAFAMLGVSLAAAAWGAATKPGRIAVGAGGGRP
jgi:hypothetical protein